MRVEALIREPVESLIEQAEAMTLAAFGATVTYSRKVFIPLTHLCRDVCHYCTFAKAPRNAGAPYLSIEQVLEIARAGEAAGCREALFTLGDRPEDRYEVARTGWRRWVMARRSAICVRRRLRCWRRPAYCRT